MNTQLTKEEIESVYVLYYQADCITIYGEKGKVKYIGVIPTSFDYYKILLIALDKIIDEHEKERRSIPIRHNDFYLISKDYAVPLWFGIDHPCNGKTAIELGIAQERTAVEVSDTTMLNQGTTVK